LSGIDFASSKKDSEVRTIFLFGKHKGRLERRPSRDYPSSGYLWKLITPKYPLVSLGPAVKNNWFVLPFRVDPPPNSIPHSPLMAIAFPAEFLTVPTSFPVVRLNPLMLPVDELFDTSSVPLSVPNVFGATV